MRLLLKRHEKNPILTPSENWWESSGVFNPGVTEIGEKVALLYRARGKDSLSRFGLATSNDGVFFQRNEMPVYESDPTNPYERLGCEDPRISKIDDIFHIVYKGGSVHPAADPRPPGTVSVPWATKTHIIKTADFKKFERLGPLFLDKETSNGFLLPEKINGRFYLYLRTYPNMYLTTSEDLIEWSDFKLVFSPRSGSWDNDRVGGGSVPFKTEKGWVSFYHGTNKKKEYAIGVIVFDFDDPSKVIYRSIEPVLTPEEKYEKEGYVGNVVFTCGTTIKNDQIYLYYGAADEVIGLATVSKQELLRSF